MWIYFGMALNRLNTFMLNMSCVYEQIVYIVLLCKLGLYLSFIFSFIYLIYQLFLPYCLVRGANCRCCQLLKKTQLDLLISKLARYK